MEALLQWAAEMGISDKPSSPPPSSLCCLGHSLVVSHFPDAGGRGLAAARDLRRGEVVLTVPRAALLTSDLVIAEDRMIACCIKTHSQRLSPTQILIVCLLAELGKGRSSMWYPYLLQLPIYYTTLANFTDFEIEALQVDDAIWVAQRAVNRIKSDWEEAINLMKELELKRRLLTFKSWIWASATVSSRTLHIPWDEAGCLCPVGDLFNYEAPGGDCIPEEVRNTKDVDFQQDRMLDGEENNPSFDMLTDGGYDEIKASYCFYARQNYRKGEQVLLGYGTYTNLDLLEHYGFLLSANPNEKAFIELDTRLCNISTWPKDSLFIHLDGCPSFMLLCALRLWATPANCRRAVGHLVHSGSLVSNENEIVVMNSLMKKCKEMLQKMLTTVEIDHDLLIFLDEFQKDTSGRICIDASSFEKEIRGFFRAHGSELEAINYNQWPVRVQKSMERWQLALRWRLFYKKTLTNCISYCKDRIDKMSS